MLAPFSSLVALSAHYNGRLKVPEVQDERTSPVAALPIYDHGPTFTKVISDIEERGLLGTE